MASDQQASASREDINRLREEMIERVESLFTQHLERLQAQRGAPSAIEDLAALSGALRVPQRPEISLRPFWRSAPELWFSTLEERFQSRNITEDSDKYFCAISNLDEDLIRIVSAAVGSSTVQRYTKLKDSLVRKFSMSESESLKNILGNVNMGSRTPSEFLEYLISSAGGILGRETVVRIWREIIPANIGVHLDDMIDASNESKNVKRADYIYSSFKRDFDNRVSFGVASISRGASERDTDMRIDNLERKLDRALDSIESHGDGRSRRGRNSDRRRNSGEGSGRDRGGLCHTHYKYGRFAAADPDSCAWKEPVDGKSHRGDHGKDRTNGASETAASNDSIRLHIEDINSGLVFMIDSGAEVSAIPRPSEWEARPVSFGMTAANQLPIQVYGTKKLEIKFSKDKLFSWTFVVANVPYPIVGGDLLKCFHLLPDLTCKCLLDASGAVVGRGFISRINRRKLAICSLSLRNDQSKFFQILHNFPEVSGLASPKRISGSNVFHYIETEGPTMDSYMALFEAVRIQRESAQDSLWASDLTNTEICLREFLPQVEEVINQRLRRINRKRMRDGVSIAAASVDLRLPALFHNGEPVKNLELKNIFGLGIPVHFTRAKVMSSYARSCRPASVRWPCRRAS
ncbi:hypothetical protein TKK_0001710 [Trichogramma kaykai]